MPRSLVAQPRDRKLAGIRRKRPPNKAFIDLAPWLLTQGLQRAQKRKALRAIPFALCGLHRGPRFLNWSEPLKWHTKLDTVSGKGNDSEEKEILPEISANGRGADEDVRKR